MQYQCQCVQSCSCTAHVSTHTYVLWCARWMQLKTFPFSGSSLYILGYCKARQVYSHRLLFKVLHKSHKKVQHPSMKLCQQTADLLWRCLNGWGRILNSMNEKEWSIFCSIFEHQCFCSPSRCTSCGLCRLLCPDVQPSPYWQHQSTPQIHTPWKAQPSWQNWKRKRRITFWSFQIKSAYIYCSIISAFA